MQFGFDFEFFVEISIDGLAKKIYRDLFHLLHNQQLRINLSEHVDLKSQVLWNEEKHTDTHSKPHFLSHLKPNVRIS